MSEITIYRELVDNARFNHSKIDTVLEEWAAINDKVLTILFCSKQEIAIYLTSTDSMLRELAEKKLKIMDNK